MRLLHALGVMFIISKLGGVIDWSWWYVLLPFYWELIYQIFYIIIIGTGRCIKGLFK